jgi:hypothetical protein
MYYWNETTGSSMTVSAEVATDNVTLTDSEAWIEVEYLGTSNLPLSTFATDQISDPIFGTPANQTSSSVTWNNVPGTPVKQVLTSPSFTPQEKGIIRARVVLAKASTVVYSDGLILSGSGRQYMTLQGSFSNEGPKSYSRSRVVNP